MSAISTGARRGESITVGAGAASCHGVQMALIIAGCLAVSALTLVYPSTPDVRPVGLDPLGPGDRPPRPRDRGRPVVEAVPDLLHGPVLALRPGPRAVPVALGRARGRPARLRDGLPDGVPAERRPLVRRARRRVGVRRAAVVATSTCATRRSATPSRCSRPSCCGRSSATSTAAATTRSTSAWRRRCCDPRPGRSSASTGSGCGSTSRGCGMRLVAFAALVPALLVPARVVGLGRAVPRRLARQRAQPRQRGVRRAPRDRAVQALRGEHRRAGRGRDARGGRRGRGGVGAAPGEGPSWRSPRSASPGSRSWR